MKNPKQHILRVFVLTFAAFGFSYSAFAEQIGQTSFDIKHYKMEVSIVPESNRLDATVDVSLVPTQETRSLTFELNGSLKIKDISLISLEADKSPAVTPTPIGKKNRPQTTTIPVNNVTFVQDRVGVRELGPSVRIDLGKVMSANKLIKLRFKYGGVLVDPKGGPLLTKRLAYVGVNEGYLMYAARWFPFHDYASDRARSDISISLPEKFQVVGYSNPPMLGTGGKFRFINNKDSLTGNFSYGRYVSKTLNYGGYKLQFHTKAGNEKLVAEYGETLGRALEYYTERFGAPSMGKKLIISQIDDESLDYYSQPGMLFLANRHFNEAKPAIKERLQREVAYQWWGLTVGLKSFDDVWLSQSLAEYSAFSLRESELTGFQLDNLRRELLEKSLTFEQISSLAKAPSYLEDQSAAYQYIMYSKGAFVHKLLRDTIGGQKYTQLLRSFLQQYRDKNASINDFEELASQVARTNLRYFFARWVEGTGVPEFEVDYTILRTNDGKFITRGSIKQNYDNLQLPVEIQLRTEGQSKGVSEKLYIEDSSVNFNIESQNKPIEVVVDPKYELLRISDNLRVSSIARRGIEQFKEGNYAEARQQFEAALKLDRSNSWVYYNLGLLFLDQQNYDLAIDNFKVTSNLGTRGNAKPAWLHVWAEIKMGNAYDAKGDRTRAVAAYKRAEEIGDTYDNAQAAVEKYLANPYNPKE